jgi:hypothetical protein
MNESNGPRILLIDIETSPIVSYTWGLWDQNVGLNQIKEDWYILSWGAKWLHDKNIMYQDLRCSKTPENDSPLLKSMWKLLDKADIVITQNGKKFDIKKLNARFIINGFQPPSSFKQIDTLEIAKKHFAFTSNKLEYMADKINTKYKKLKHEQFSGFEMWKECLKGNMKAWKAMEKYNKYDVLSLEELYNKMIVWDKGVNLNHYYDYPTQICSCGSTEQIKKGFEYSAVSKFQRYKCTNCGKSSVDRVNLFTKDKRKSLRK